MTSRYIFPSTINQIKKGLLGAGVQQQTSSLVQIKGWVKNIRHQKQFSFLEVNDGSSLQGLQVIGKPNQFQGITNGSCIQVKGNLVQSPGKGQQWEIQLIDDANTSNNSGTVGNDNIKILGHCSESEYPLQPKHHSFEYLREIAHLRSRSNTLGAMIRVRNTASTAIHDYFQSNHFQLIHTPIITAGDCEGGGEQFQIITNNQNQKNNNNNTVNHFFGEPAYLTVSGQLEGEIFASSHSRIYTFGPTFRAEKSSTARHLAEFWMVEPEMAFIQQSDNIDVAEDFIKRITESIVDKCKEDIEFFNKRIDTGLYARLEKTIQSPFIRLEYRDAIKILSTPSALSTLTTPIKWGEDLGREHEKYLTQHFNNIPVFVINWPKDIKPFYMRINDDGETVANMDLLVPEVGELIGGSIREERFDILSQRLKQLNMNQESYSWYSDLRKFGSAPHGGFGLGFERYLQYITGLQNIRDVVPIPRHQNYCKF